LQKCFVAILFLKIKFAEFIITDKIVLKQFCIVKSNINFQTDTSKFCFEATGRKELIGTNYFFLIFRIEHVLLFLQKMKLSTHAGS